MRRYKFNLFLKLPSLNHPFFILNTSLILIGSLSLARLVEHASQEPLKVAMINSKINIFFNFVTAISLLLNIWLLSYDKVVA